MALDGIQEQNIKYLFCFDFDETITNKNTFNYINQNSDALYGQPLTDEIKERCFSYCGFKNPELTRDTIMAAMINQHFVSIVSFNCYPDIINYYLKKLGLDDAEISQIKIITGFPTIDSQARPTLTNTPKTAPLRKFGKQLHIDSAKQWAISRGFGGANMNIVLIDDDLINVGIARRNGYIAIRAPSNISDLHHDYILKLSDYIGEFKSTAFDAYKNQLDEIRSKIDLPRKLALLYELAEDNFTTLTCDRYYSSEPVDLLEYKSTLSLLGELQRQTHLHKTAHPEEMVPIYDLIEKAPIFISDFLFDNTEAKERYLNDNTPLIKKKIASLI